MTPRALISAIWTVNFAVLGLIYLAHLWLSALFAGVVATVLIVSLAGRRDEGRRFFLRRLFGLPVVMFLVVLISCGIVGYIESKESELVFLATMILSLETYLIWRVLLFPEPPSDDWRDGSGPDDPVPSPFPTPLDRKRSPLEVSLAWREKSASSKASVEVN